MRARTRRLWEKVLSSQAEKQAALDRLEAAVDEFARTVDEFAAAVRAREADLENTGRCACGFPGYVQWENTRALARGVPTSTSADGQASYADDHCRFHRLWELGGPVEGTRR